MLNYYEDREILSISSTIKTGFLVYALDNYLTNIP